MALEYTPEQKACVEQLVGPVDISAGAGSGKTFTLTQRIAHALVDSSSGVESIDQVCAITFTEKAASELKGRVRSTLRAEGLYDQARKVDSAWISTIHGMCARILRQCALDLGVDPEFEVISDKASREMLDSCLNRAIEEIEGNQGEFAPLFAAYPVQTGATSVSSLVKSLLSQAATLRGGLDDLRCAPVVSEPRDVARKLLSAYEEALPFYEQADLNKPKNAAALENAQETHRILSDYVIGGGENTVEALLEVLDRCPKAGKLMAGALKEATGLCASVHDECASEAVMLQGSALLPLLLKLAGRVQAHFQQAKRAQGAMDNNDLIKGALEALDIPKIHERYAHKFRLVMVDEFQDTDALQLAIVRHLCGEGMKYLCTVGDAQQSIYAFRGADIGVYRAYQRSLEDSSLHERGGQPQKLTLTSNFRSHGDILAFVKKTCSQPTVFGEEFLDLRAHYDGKDYRARQPRVQLNATVLVPEKNSGSIADAQKVQAKQIAAYFKRMHEEGQALSDMALLLGGMTCADLYAQAIRDQGFACIITGGSLFANAPETKAVNSLLQAIVNPRNTQALYEVLAGPVFNVGSEDLLMMGTMTDANGVCHRNKLYSGLRERQTDLRENPHAKMSPVLRNATKTLEKAAAALRCRSVTDALSQALLDSGWIARLQEAGPEGMAALGNVMKAVRMVGDLQQDNHFGADRTAAWFADLMKDGMKEAPGALNLEGQEAIRIMTIHSSKGLEFPVVAMADFVRSSRSYSLAMQRIEGQTFISLKGNKGKFCGKDLAKSGFDAVQARVSASGCEITKDVVESADAVKRHALLNEVANKAELEEAQRLFYVAATRAKEALGVFMCIKTQKTNPLKAYVGTVDDVRRAFFGEGEFPDEFELVDYGGSAPAPFTVNRIHAADLKTEMAPSLPAERPTVSVPPVKPAKRLDEEVPERKGTGLFSYSSLAAAHQAGQDALSLPTQDLYISSDGEASTENSVTQEFAAVRTADDDKATDFGSALHRAAQIAALVGPDAARGQLDSLCATYGVKGRDRLGSALERWLSSKACAEAFAYESYQPEVPFSITVGDGVLEGEIDLLCTNEHARAGKVGGGKALIVDYKTGGSPAETPDQLYQKHELQAKCYAYATLSQGYAEVELVFARVEQDDPAGVDTLQTVSYRFAQSDNEGLCLEIASYMQ